MFPNCRDIVDSNEYFNRIQEACDYVRKAAGTNKFDVSLILGSGQKDLAYTIVKDPKIIRYADIPYFPQATNIGHGNEMCVADIHGKKMLVFTGRIHTFEGYRTLLLQFIVHLSAFLGVQLLITTNAAGGVSEEI